MQASIDIFHFSIKHYKKGWVINYTKFKLFLHIFISNAAMTEAVVDH